MRRFPRIVRFVAALATFVALVALETPATPGADERDHPPGPVTRASDFVDSIGVVSHFDYWGTPYNAAWSAISAALVGSGIRHIRDGSMDHSPLYLSRLAFLATHGIAHSAIFKTNVTVDQVRDMLQTFGPHVDFVEPQNEYNATHDPNWTTTISAEQAVLYDAVHGDDRFKGVTVLGPALNFASYYAALGPLDRYEDAGNLHAYPCNLNPGTQLLHFGLETNHRLIRASTQNKPIWTSETGYGDDVGLTPQCGLPDETIAKYVPRMVAVRYLGGEPRMYFYQLADMPTDRRFGKLGLLQADGTPKPQFVALRELIHVVDDAAQPAFTPAPVDLGLEALPPTVRSLALEKHDGTYDVLLWQEVPSADPRSLAPIAVAPLTVTLRVPPAARNVRIFSYAGDWTMHDRPTTPSDGRVSIPVTDAICVLQFATRAAAATTSSGRSTSTRV